MTYVTDQTSQELRAHMRRLKAMKGWNEPLADRLYREIVEFDETVAKLRAAQLAAAQAQEPVGFVESAVRGAGGFHARFSSGVFIPAGTQLFADPIPQQPVEAHSVDKRLFRLQEAVIEMYCDWKKGDFVLPRLAQLDLEACFEAANCGELFAAAPQPKEKQ